MHAAAVAALPFRIVLAHIHGGESTEGLIDEPIRHSLTKMSHLHFPSTDHYARRIMQMGEDPWRVTVSGAPSLDNLSGLSFLSSTELQSRYGLDLTEPPLLVTYHPVTLEYENTKWQIEELLAALEKMDKPVVFTYPNADTHGRVIIREIDTYVRSHSNARAVQNLGTQGYFSLMRCSTAMVGNSSSGIIEAASFKLPVVNIGNRQRGRIHGPNVIDVDYGCGAIGEGIRTVLSEAFRKGFDGQINPYGDGQASGRIVDDLKRAELNDRMLLKRFYEPSNGATGCELFSLEQ
jgi:UDP-hydrolysing UDP-N-acetyl-D-glucosamine 2-epimerase